MPSNTIMKILAVSLLVFSLVIGVLLAVTIGERNTAQTALQHTTVELKEKKEDLKEEKEKREQAETEFNGCQAALGVQNKALQEGQQIALSSAAESVERAGAVLATLPQKIAADRLSVAIGPAPAAANKWMEALFK